MNPEINQLTEQIIGAAIEVHRELGPGLPESACPKALAHEFTLRGIAFEEQKPCPVRYKDLLINDAYRLDFLVDGQVVVELKTADQPPVQLPRHNPHQRPPSPHSVASVQPPVPSV
jgi:GxxExxY protein